VSSLLPGVNNAAPRNNLNMNQQDPNTNTPNTNILNTKPNTSNRRLVWSLSVGVGGSFRISNTGDNSNTGNMPQIPGSASKVARKCAKLPNGAGGKFVSGVKSSPERPD
jgi:hypothetical protein